MQEWNIGPSLKRIYNTGSRKKVMENEKRAHLEAEH
jgi:hypothetical protein